jgi:hypothetical protein
MAVNFTLLIFTFVPSFPQFTQKYQQEKPDEFAKILARR